MQQLKVFSPLVLRFLLLPTGNQNHSLASGLNRALVLSPLLMGFLSMPLSAGNILTDIELQGTYTGDCAGNSSCFASPANDGTQLQTYNLRASYTSRTDGALSQLTLPAGSGSPSGPYTSGVTAGGYVDTANLMLGGYASATGFAPPGAGGAFSTTMVDMYIQNGFTVSAGTSGLAVGTPVTLYLTGNVKGTLSASNPYVTSANTAQSAASFVSAVYDSNDNTLAYAYAYASMTAHVDGAGCAEADGQELLQVVGGISWSSAPSDSNCVSTGGTGAASGSLYFDSASVPGYGPIPFQAAIGDTLVMYSELWLDTSDGTYPNSFGGYGSASADFSHTALNGIGLDPGLTNDGVQLTFDAPPTGSSGAPEPGTGPVIGIILVAISWAMRTRLVPRP